MILNGQQIVSLFFLSIFTIFVIGMWLMQFNKIMDGSLSGGGNNNQTASEYNAINSSNTGTSAQDAARDKDTDNDGLSDWDELYVHKTSPFIEDSDSDGYSDGQEIQLGKDPNCPTGHNCGGGSFVDDPGTQLANPSAPTSDVDAGLFGDFDLETLQQASDQLPDVNFGDLENLNDPSLLDIFSGNSNAATLRSMLLDAGLDANMLNQISDEDLMGAYQDTLAN